MPVTINGSNTPTAGGVVYGDGTNYASTAAGTSGQVLTSAGAGAPTWTTPSAGAMTLISTATASNSATIDFTGLTSAYKNYVVMGSNILPSINWSSLWFRTSTNNGVSYDATGGDYEWSTTGPSGTTTGSFNAAYMASAVWSTADRGGMNFNIVIPNPSAAGWTFYYGTAGFSDYSNGTGGFLISGVRESTTGAVNAIRFLFNSGNITSGTFKLYGIS